MKSSKQPKSQGYQICQPFFGFHVWRDGSGEIEGDVLFGLYYAEGETQGEMAMRWHRLGKNAAAPRLESFSDSWKMFPTISWLFKELAKADEHMTIDQFAAVLEKHGFRKLTDKKMPLI
jgi:hypothetical protein